MFCCSYIINKFCSKNARVVFNVTVFWGSTNVRYTMDYIFLLRYLHFEENLQGKKKHILILCREIGQSFEESL